MQLLNDFYDSQHGLAHFTLRGVKRHPSSEFATLLVTPDAGDSYDVVAMKAQNHVGGPKDYNVYIVNSIRTSDAPTKESDILGWASCSALGCPALCKPAIRLMNCSSFRSREPMQS